ncbi:MAG: guanylate kinase [Ichthyobacteriaceae bacterium]|nr:guanylate kinase [Ichthyobacteriaceae bacterium]
MKKQGKLIVFSAPSGSGKTTIVKNLLTRDLGLEFSISAASRKPREGEVNGKDYYFLSPEDFKNKADNGEFLEWEEVYTDNYYGTLKSEVERIWEKGNTVVFDIDVIGGLNIKKQFSNNTLAVFVKPPSVEELRVRLEGRGTETAEKIEMRLAKAEEEISYSKDFDYVLINDNLEVAQNEASELIVKFIEK